MSTETDLLWSRLNHLTRRVNSLEQNVANHEQDIGELTEQVEKVERFSHYHQNPDGTGSVANVTFHRASAPSGMSDDELAADRESQIPPSAPSDADVIADLDYGGRTPPATARECGTHGSGCGHNEKTCTPATVREKAEDWRHKFDDPVHVVGTECPPATARAFTIDDCGRRKLVISADAVAQTPPGVMREVVHRFKEELASTPASDPQDRHEAKPSTAREEKWGCCCGVAGHKDSCSGKCCKSAPAKAESGKDERRVSIKEACEIADDVARTAEAERAESGKDERRWALEVHANGNLCCKSFTGRPVCYWCINDPSNTTSVEVIPLAALLEAENRAEEFEGRLALRTEQRDEARATADNYRKDWRDCYATLEKNEAELDEARATVEKVRAFVNNGDFRAIRRFFEEAALAREPKGKP